MWDAMGRAEEAGLGAAAVRAVTGFRNVMQSLMATATDANVADVVEAVLERSGYLDAREAERTIEARGRIENLEELVGVAREYDSSGAQERSLSALLPEESRRFLRELTIDPQGMPRHGEHRAGVDGCFLLRPAR